MLKKKEGYSLVVLIIAITVIIILTTTAIISIKNINKDKDISKFMSDLQEVKQYSLEYFAKTGTLPVENVNGEFVNIEDTIYTLLKDNDSLSQIHEDDLGGYYYVDLTKLGKIHLQDTERGYILNEGTLNVYVENPFEYNGEKYYTITPELSGKDVVQYENIPFDVAIMGNPMVWSTEAEILVSVTDVSFSGDTDDWNFKWMKGSGDATTFKDGENINFFNYGETITLKENGIYTIYVESPEHKIITRKIIVSKIDDKAPTIEYKDGTFYVDDAETGIKNIRYKIDDEKLTDSARKSSPEYYTAETISNSDLNGLSKYLWGEENLKGDTIEKYVEDYEKYLEKLEPYEQIAQNPEATSGERDNAKDVIKAINKSYPQFAYDNTTFSNTDRNIVLYVEDMAGNQTFYSAVTRNELLNSEYVTVGGETLSDAKVVINNNEAYTNNPNLSLYLRAKGAQYVFVTATKGESPTWEAFDTDTKTITVAGDGEKTIYAFYKDISGKIASCYDKILLDETKPSQDAPTITFEGETFTIKCNQTDTDIVDGKETQSGLTGDCQYGIKKSSETEYTWYNKTGMIPILISGEEYSIVTKVTDKAGNEQISDATEITIE